MRCGAKNFDIEFKTDGVNQIESVPARTSAEARKIIRQKCGSDVEIITVRERKKPTING